jgi:hypothetical protein
VRVLATVTDVFPHRSTLVPYISQLLREGERGQVVLLDDASDVVVATYHLASGIQRPSVYRPRPWPPGTENRTGRTDHPLLKEGVDTGKCREID